MTPIISRGRTEARLSSRGGDIIRLVTNGRDILTPRIELGEKIRGGSHGCVPWFGHSDRASKKHGFLRDTNASRMHVNPDGDQAKFDFFLPGRTGYEWPLACSMETRILDNGFESILRIERPNDNVEGRAPLLAAFHPYFAGRASAAFVDVGNREYESFGERTKIVRLRGGKVRIMFPDKTLEMELGGAFGSFDSHLALWTDNEDSYLCVEPIIEAPDLFDTPNGCHLISGEGLEISMTITVK